MKRMMRWKIEKKMENPGKLLRRHNYRSVSVQNQLSIPPHLILSPSTLGVGAWSGTSPPETSIVLISRLIPVVKMPFVFRGIRCGAVR